MKNDIELKIASIDDAERILEIQKSAFHDQALIYNDFHLPPLTQTVKDLQDEFKTRTFYKVEFDGKIIASVRCYNLNNTLYIEKLVVVPELQNRGIGTAIMQKIESMYSSDINRYELFTGHKSSRNLHIYRKLGYREKARQPLNDNCVLIVMEKPGHNN